MARPKANPKPASAETVTAAPQPTGRQVQVSQSDVPSYSLAEALRIPLAIADNYAAKPTRTIDVAGALNMTPGSSHFRQLAGASVAYGLTTGSAFTAEISITPLGMRIVRPMNDGEDIAAKRDALLKPRILGEFLRKYDGNALPTDTIAKNVLEQMGVPAQRLDKVLEFVIGSAGEIGLIRNMGGKRFVDLGGVAPSSTEPGAVVGVAGMPKVALPQQRTAPADTAPNGVAVSVAPAVYVNIEIHIDADASPEAIEHIFKNMRRYVLNGNTQAHDDAADSS